jgi:hypothetical protein
MAKLAQERAERARDALRRALTEQAWPWCREQAREPRRGPSVSVRSRTWCSCWMVHGGFGNRPSESHLRTTGWVTAQAAAA